MEYKDIFIKVIINTFKELSNIDFLYEELEQQDKYHSEKEVTSQMSIYGEGHEGMIILNLDRDVIKYLYYNIQEDEVDEEDDFTIEDFCGELTNIIAGKFIEFLDIDIVPSLSMINFDSVEYSTVKRDKFDFIRFYDAQGKEFFIYTYLTLLRDDF